MTNKILQNKNNHLPSNVNFRADINGLRAVAIIAVILFHFFPNLIKSGFVGVDIFFVISGYLITKIILGQVVKGEFSFVSFYSRRARRILPALFLVIGVSYVVAIAMFSKVDMVWFARSAYYASMQISNFFFQRNVDYFNANTDSGPLLHTWSLAVEEQFYFLLPLLIFFVWKNTKSEKAIFYAIVLLSAVSLAISIYLVGHSQKLAFYSIQSRFFELGVGSIAVFIERKQNLNSWARLFPICGLALIASSFLIIEQVRFPGFAALLPCAGAALVILSRPNNFLSRFLSISPMQLIGNISYSLYLWHLPILVFYSYEFRGEGVLLKDSLLLISSLILISYLSWRFV